MFSAFIRCSDERSDHSCLFSQDVVMVGAHPRGNLPPSTPQLLPSWKHKVVFTQEERFSALVLIIWRFIVEDKLYHAPFTAWLSTPRGLRYLFELMRDIMERFWSCHRCVTHVTQPQCVPLRRSSYLQLISRAVTAANVQHLRSASLYICTLTHTRYWIHATRHDCL